MFVFIAFSTSTSARCQIKGFFTRIGKVDLIGFVVVSERLSLSIKKDYSNLGTNISSFQIEALHYTEKQQLYVEDDELLFKHSICRGGKENSTGI